MSEFVFKDAKEDTTKWVLGFASREAAIEAGLRSGLTQITTARVEDGSPSYFARFEARTILSRMISGLQNGEDQGKVIGGHQAIEALRKIESVDVLDVTSPERLLQVDLMNRLEKTVESWIFENDIDFTQPKFTAYMSEKLYVAGADLNIQMP